jgi:DNA-binding beta-propeller fold protein YncE
VAGALAACGGSGSPPGATGPGADAGTDGGADARVDAAPDAGEGGVDAAGDGGPLEASPPASVPTDSRKSAASSPVVFDPLRGGVWTANGDVGTASYVDVDARRVVREVPIGQDVRSIALSPDAAFVAAVDRAGASVSLLDAETGVVRRAIPLGGHPRACVWDSADPRWLYVAVEDDGTVAIVDRTAGALAATVSVGRLPSGLAVAAQRHELYVTHRIDARVTVVDLDARAVAADVSLADQPLVDPSQPHGTPFGFESMAITPDDHRAWVPHELLAPTHPIVFNQTLFPAVSVVDLSARAEVTTDPGTGRTDGRKNLFDAIDIPDTTEQPSVVSQICAAAIHPAGLVAWAIACGSDDLLKFDVTQGVATDLQRDLPGDHPVGLGLDDTGQRLFVISDQSHTLLTYDTANGDLVARTQPYGDPIQLVAKDPVDPALRQGLTLFFSADSARGTLATTGNDWMSCGGCHLDGFGSGTAGLFAAMRATSPSTDAQIGHAGLRDQFASAATPADSSFDPHDVLVALLEQGGLAPDRTGVDPTGAVDPAAPTADATTMAQSIARVVARDLSLGPSWLQAAGGAPNLAWDTQYCGSASCHPNEYAAWSTSVHALAASDPMFLHGVDVARGLSGAAFTRVCAGCHDPVSLRAGDASLQSHRGVTCLGCHDVTAQTRAGGNDDLTATSHDWSTDHKAWGLASLDKLRQPEFCAGCHQQFVPGDGLVSIGTATEYESSTYPPATRCIDCHAVRNAQGVADHSFPGGNVYLAQHAGYPSLASAQTLNLTKNLAVMPQRTTGGVSVQVQNRGVGHSFPTGVTDIHEAWVEVQAKDASGALLARIGGPAADGSIPASAARLGTDFAQADGTVLLDHELTLTARVPFDRRVAPGASQTLLVPLPATLPAGTATLEAVLFYRNVRTPFYRSATADAGTADAGTAPDIEVARVAVP